MINMHSKYDNMRRNGIFYVLIYINNHVITSVSYMLSGLIVYAGEYVSSCIASLISIS